MNKKRFFFLVLVLAGVAHAAGSGGGAGMDDTVDYVAKGLKLGGMIMAVAVNLLWIVFPAGTALLSYNYFKKKNDGAGQEDLGVKAALSIVGAGIAGLMAAFLVVGNIGMAAGGSGTTTLADGNKFMISNVLGKVTTYTGTKIGH